MSLTSKIVKLVRNFSHQIGEAKPKAKTRGFKGSLAFAKWNPIRVLALGALMVLGMVMYFNLASGAADTASQNNQREDSSLIREQQKAAGPQDYEVARAANAARREDEARATMSRVEAYIAKNKAYEAAPAANQARREAEAEATMSRVEAYIAKNKAYEAALAANQARREAEAEATMWRVEAYIAKNETAK